MNVSIIIPTFNEEQYIGRLLSRILSVREREELEVIVVDGGSTDRTEEIVRGFPVRFEVVDRSRAVQMNAGASLAKYDLLYFIHADTLPPNTFMEDISTSSKEGFEACCYRSKFERSRFLMKFNEFATRYEKLYCRGGDQSLAVSKQLFTELGGFDESMEIMEEYPIIQQLMQRGKFHVIPKDILISSRKYDSNSWLKVSRANLKAYRMYKRGEDSAKIKRTYREALNLA